MFIISMKKIKETDPNNSWAYLMEDFDKTIYFSTVNTEQAKKFNTIRDAQKFFKHNKNEIIKRVNLSKYDLSTFAIRRIKYISEASLHFTEKDLSKNNEDKIEIGSVVSHKDNLFLEGTVYDIKGKSALVEFSYGPSSGGSLWFDIDELKRLSNT